jgi:hypothetical protein
MTQKRIFSAPTRLTGCLRGMRRMETTRLKWAGRRGVSDVGKKPTVTFEEATQFAIDIRQNRYALSN